MRTVTDFKTRAAASPAAALRSASSEHIRRWIPILAVTTLAIAVRAVWMWASPNRSSSDFRTYYEYASLLATGQVDWKLVIGRMTTLVPGYIYFLAALTRSQGLLLLGELFLVVLWRRRLDLLIKWLAMALTPSSSYCRGSFETKLSTAHLICS